MFAKVLFSWVELDCQSNMLFSFQATQLVNKKDDDDDYFRCRLALLNWIIRVKRLIMMIMMDPWTGVILFGFIH
jgi:hypothetical protein